MGREWTWQDTESELVKGLQEQQVRDCALFVLSRERARKGHSDVAVYLRDPQGRISSNPCLTGLYSVGRRDPGAAGHFFQTELSSQVEFDSREGVHKVDMIDARIAEDLFRQIGRVIRPGGQLFLSYENEDRFREHTEKAFRLGVPLGATMLGKLVVLSGCPRVWSHYGAEGRFRIEGQKPAGPGEAARLTDEILRVLERYLESPISSADRATDRYCRENARHLVSHLESLGFHRNTGDI